MSLLDLCPLRTIEFKNEMKYKKWKRIPFNTAYTNRKTIIHSAAKDQFMSTKYTATQSCLYLYLCM